jgi:hypothetical protein
MLGFQTMAWERHTIVAVSTLRMGSQSYRQHNSQQHNMKQKVLRGLYAWLITGFVIRVTRRVSQMEQETVYPSGASELISAFFVEFVLFTL